jgi:hypothetical protein
MSLIFTQGDTGPDLNGVIHAQDDPGSPSNLTDATVRFQMRLSEGHRYKVNAVATIIDEVTGAVRYAWGSNDLAHHGVFDAQFEVTYPGGKVITTQPPVELTVRRQ